MTTIQNRFTINGYLDTNNSVLDNLEAIASAAGTWITFDHNIGKWSIVINKADSSTYSFNNDNIIGDISLTETNFNEMYNSVEIQFPHEDLLDQTDWVRFDIPSADRLPGEPLNRLTIRTTLLNDPVQAEQIAITELKQSRANKIIEFSSDFTCLGLTAGDIIDITNAEFEWTGKLFRIISVAEEDDTDGNVVISFTALEYQDDVYDYSNLSRYSRTRANGITPQLINTEIDQSNDVATGNDLGRLLALAGISSLLDFANVVDALTGENNVEITPGSCLGAPDVTLSDENSACVNIGASITVSTAAKTLGGCEVPTNPVYALGSYEITGINAADINIPLTGSFTGGSLSFTSTTSAGGKTAVFTFKDASGNTLSTKNFSFLSGYAISLSPSPISGALRVEISSNAPSGTSLPWTVSGTNLSSVYTGATSGSVTVGAGGAATVDFPVTTNATSEDATITVSVSGGNCGSAEGGYTYAATVANPNDPTLEVCSLVSIPVLYCPVYDGTTLIGVNVKATARVFQAPSGGVAVPLSVSVSGGSIIVNSTINVEPSGIGAPGADIEVITSFDPPQGPSDPLITGTLTTVKGTFN